MKFLEAIAFALGAAVALARWPAVPIVLTIVMLGAAVVFMT